MKDCATIIIRKIDAKVNMPGAINSKAEICFVSINEAICRLIGVEADCPLPSVKAISACWIMGGAVSTYRLMPFENAIFRVKNAILGIAYLIKPCNQSDNSFIKNKPKA